MTLEEKITENYKRYIERLSFYKKFGFDIEKERDFIVQKAHPIYGDILEIGTGKGYFTIALAKEGYNFTSIDISKEAQEFAKANIKYLGLGEQVDFKTANAEYLSFNSRSFDIIFSINTIHHLKNPFRVIDELTRIISFEGKIVLSDFTKEGLEVLDRVHAEEGRRHEVNRMALNDIENYFIDKGFNVQRDRTRLQELLIAYHQII